MLHQLFALTGEKVSETLGYLHLYLSGPPWFHYSSILPVSVTDSRVLKEILATFTSSPHWLQWGFCLKTPVHVSSGCQNRAFNLKTRGSWWQGHLGVSEGQKSPCGSRRSWGSLQACLLPPLALGTMLAPLVPPAWTWEIPDAAWYCNSCCSHLQLEWALGCLHCLDDKLLIQSWWLGLIA